MDSALPGLADALEKTLAERAKLCGWATTASEILVKTIGDGLLEPLIKPHSVADEPAEFEVPRFRRAIELSPAAVSILVCGLDTTDASYRSALWWTGLVRSGIAPSRRSDLHLFLIGPSGSRDSDDWHGKRSRIESDERFCRKFVWLPSSSPEAEEIGTFLDRTFLAKPWEGDPATPRSLDPLEQLLQGFSSPNMSSDEAQAWIDRLSVLTADGLTGGIAEDLVGIMGRKR